MAERIRSFGWDATSLGDPRGWPQTLRTVVDLILQSPLPQIVLWGPDLIQLYNDSYAIVMGAKHPSGLGQPTSECWPEVWSFNRQHYAAVMNGKTVSLDSQYLPLERNGAAEPTWFDLTYSPVRDDAGAISGVLVTTIEITNRVNAEDALRHTERRFQTLVEGIPQIVWRGYDGGHWTWASPQWTECTGQAEADSHGFGWLEPVHPDDRDAAMELWGSAIERGFFEGDYRLFDVSEQRYRWFQTRAMPVRDEANQIIEWLGTSTDVDDLRALHERQGVLVAELQHRTMNLIGVVRSLAEATIRSSADLDDFAAKFEDRVFALARVQRLLSRRQDSERVTIADIVRAELEAAGMLDDPRVTLDGPNDVTLRSRSVQTFAMAVHELMTNASKYGAFKQPAGRLTIGWGIEPDPDDQTPLLRLDWTETGANMTDPSTAAQGTGQGRALIERALPYQLNARTSYVMASDGVKCSILAPILQ